MKTKYSLVAVGALVAVGLMTQSAKANLNLTADVSLYQPSNPDSITVDSSAVQDLNISDSTYLDYEYSYAFSGPIGLISMSVYFPTATAGTFGAGPAVSPNTATIYGANVNWTFDPETTSGTVYFWSPIPPTLGDISAQDGGLWGDGNGNNQYGVVVPAVPDGGATLMFLGASLAGLGALRRKLAK